jgi:hypothetical protein
LKAEAEKWDNAKEQIVRAVMEIRTMQRTNRLPQRLYAFGHRFSFAMTVNKKNKQIAATPLRFWPLRQLADSQ